LVPSPFLIEVGECMLQEVKEYLRVDGDVEDRLIESLIIAGHAFIKNATTPDIDTESELYKTALKILVTHWYENREPTGKAGNIPFSLTDILIQLSLGG
jgi:uncharacterized phage protein (predicted DNA packaging)